MKLSRQTRGFTLIEMLVVIAVISILAGVVLVGITGFQAGARDTRRVSDLRSAQNLVELYYTKCGEYPGGADCAGGEVGQSGGWDNLVSSLSDSGIAGSNKLPEASDAGATFYYRSCATGGSVQNYVLGVELERGNAAAANDIDPATCGLSGIVDCTDTEVFCVSP